jgi:UDP-N-acetylmuramyl pentapeptide phosphotransferase/UDP-N-acetylglucosamine-1-phosphate transferase
MTNLLELILPVSIALFISIYSIPLVIKWVNKKGFLALPNHRTSHINPTPSMGGIGIYLGLLATLPFLAFNMELVAVLICITILFLAGYWDDRFNMKSLVKFAIQLSCAITLYLSGFKIDNLHGIMGVNEISEILSAAITILFIVGVTNAFNLIDGIDGLAGGISLINSFFFGLIFLMNNQINYAIIAFTLSASLLGFLKYNLSPAKIFMGDTGSLFLGLLMSVFIIKTFQTNGSTELSISVSVILIFLPVFDTLRIFMLRILKKKSPFSADKNHLHHVVLKVVRRHSRATIIICLFHFSLLSLAYLRSYLNSSVVLTSLIALLLVFNIVFMIAILSITIIQKIQKNKYSIELITTRNNLLKNL